MVQYIISDAILYPERKIRDFHFLVTDMVKTHGRSLSPVQSIISNSILYLERGRWAISISWLPIWWRLKLRVDGLTVVFDSLFDWEGQRNRRPAPKKEERIHLKKEVRCDEYLDKKVHTFQIPFEDFGCYRYIHTVKYRGRDGIRAVSYHI